MPFEQNSDLAAEGRRGARFGPAARRGIVVEDFGAVIDPLQRWREFGRSPTMPGC